MRASVNFTTGRILPAIVRFALPVLAGELLQNLYNSVDSLVVGNFVSATALAAVGVCNTLSNLLIGFFNGMSVGCTVVVARLFGKGEEEKLAPAVRHAFTFSVLLGVVLSIAGILLSPVLLTISGANEKIFAEALAYLRIYLAGLMFTVIYNCGAGILRALGDSRTPFYILTVSSVVNIGLDILLVTVLPWGTVGVALATVVSQCLSALLIAGRIKMRTGTRCVDAWEMFRSGIGTVKYVLSVGFSAGIQGALISFSNLFVWQHINRFSTAAVAGISVAQRIDKFVNLPAKAYGTAVTTFTGQNSGAENYTRIKKGMGQVLLLSFSTILLLALIIYPNAAALVSLFNRDEVVVETAVGMMHVIIPLYGFMALREIMLGVLRGSGKSTVPMLLSLTGMVGIRQLYLAVASSLNSSIKVIFYSYPVGWGSTAIILVCYFLAIRKKIHLGRPIVSVK